MAQCDPDWQSTLRRSYFRGAYFWTESNEISYGRRIKTHEFPNRDRPLNEDLGEKAITISVTAYLASATVLADKDALVAACRKRGPGSLGLPEERPQQVVCTECKRTASKDKQGYIAFSLTFGEAGDAAWSGIETVAYLQRMVSLVGGTAIPAIAADFQSVFNTIGDASWVLDHATSTVGGWLDYMDGLRQEVPMQTTGSATGASLYSSLLSLNAEARELCYGGNGLPYVTGSRSDSTSDAVTSGLPARVADIVGEMRLACTDPADAVKLLSALARYDLREIPDPPLASSPADPTYLAPSSSVDAQRLNEIAIGSLFRRTAMVEWAITAAEIDYTDRPTAIKARADLSEVMANEIATATGPALLALDKVRGRATQSISMSIADQRATIIVEGHTSRTALAWSQRLYGNSQHYSDLVKRNRVRHPAFMPATFEAEAP